MAVAIVTGASRGFGRALATALADDGWSLVIDSRGEAELTTTAEALRPRLSAGSSLAVLAGDVADAEHGAELVRVAGELGGVDLVVNNASALGPTPLPHLRAYSASALRRVMEVNVLGPLALIQAAEPLLRQSPTPGVVNITSDASVEAYEGWGGYGASKAALDRLSAVLGVEEPWLRVWAVDPGDMRTKMHQDAFPGEDISDRPLPETVVPDLMAFIKRRPPSGRYRLADMATLRTGSPT